jgi:zinc transport system substrate-binding protein
VSNSNIIIPIYFSIAIITLSLPIDAATKDNAMSWNILSSILPLSVNASTVNETIGNQGTTSLNTNQDKLEVYTSFYPIYDFVNKIGKDIIDVSTIVPPGIEPHDFEPTPKQIIELQNSDVIFINGAGFEKWIERIQGVNTVDLSSSLSIEKTEAVPDPHIWLDPLMVKNISAVILDTLIKIDSHNAKYYENNYVKLSSNLDKLNSDIVGNLTDCKLDDFIAFHDSFSYFAKRYGLTQHSIEGLAPEADVDPQRVSDTINLAKQLGVNVIFTEESIDPRLSNTIANEINGKVLVLNPIEVISQQELESGEEYFSKMYENLENLKVALDCKG